MVWGRRDRAPILEHCQGSPGREGAVRLRIPCGFWKLSRAQWRLASCDRYGSAGPIRLENLTIAITEVDRTSQRQAGLRDSLAGGIATTIICVRTDGAELEWSVLERFANRVMGVHRRNARRQLIQLRRARTVTPRSPDGRNGGVRWPVKDKGLHDLEGEHGYQPETRHQRTRRRLARGRRRNGRSHCTRNGGVDEQSAITASATRGRLSSRQ